MQVVFQAVAKTSAHVGPSAHCRQLPDQPPLPELNRCTGSSRSRHACASPPPPSPPTVCGFNIVHTAVDRHGAKEDPRVTRVQCRLTVTHPCDLCLGASQCTVWLACAPLAAHLCCRAACCAPAYATGVVYQRARGLRCQDDILCPVDASSSLKHHLIAEGMAAGAGGGVHVAGLCKAAAVAAPAPAPAAAAMAGAYSVNQ